MLYFICFTLVIRFDYSEEMFAVNGPINITQNNCLGSLTITKEYEISFEVCLISDENAKSIITINKGSNCSEFSLESRIVDVLFHGSSLLFFVVQINGTLISYLSRKNSTTMWTKINIKQYLSKGNYFYAFKIDEKIVYLVQNNDAQVYENATLYASNPIFESRTGLIKNLMVRNAPPTSGPISETSRKLNYIKNVQVTETNILYVTNYLSEIVYSGKLFSIKDVQLIPSIMTNVINKISSLENVHLKINVTSGILFSIDGLFTPDLHFTESKSQTLNLSAEFLNIIDYLGKQQTENVSISMKNVGMASYNTKIKSNSILITSIIIENITGVSITNGEITSSQSKDYIFLPQELFLEQSEIHVYSFIFKGKIFFRESAGIIDSVILSATLNGNAKKKNNKSISMKFSRNSKASGIRRCHFYIIEEQRWSNKGCNTSYISASEVFCNCEHLTNFALILDVDQSGNNSLTLSIITWIGCAVSIVGLIITIISYSAFAKLRMKLAPKILIILCLNLLCTLILFLALVEQTKHRTLCQTVASLLQFFVLSTFFWMAIEGLNLYRMFIKVFGTSTSSCNFLLKSSIFGWGMPLVITLITSVSKPNYLGPSSDNDVQLCVVRSLPFFLGILLPVCVVMVANIVVLVLVLIGIEHNSIPKKNRKKKKVRIAFVCSLLLGVTWLFAVLAIGKGRDIFQWLFCIFNSLQGFFIFLFYTVKNKNVKEQWMLFLLKKKRGMNDKQVNSSLQKISTATLSFSANSSQVNGGFISSEETKL